MEIFHKMISAALNLPEKQISNTLGLLAEGATILSSAATVKKSPADSTKCR